MAKLNLSGAIAEDLKTAASDSFIDSLKMIEVEDIQPNEDNFYTMSEIEELAEDIERQGLMSVLVAEIAEDGKYRLISGHRRLAAVKLLIDEGRRKSTTVPCYIKSAKSHEETQLDLIMLNATQRTYTSADTMREYEELERIFKALDEAGKHIKGKTRDKIAKVLNVSPAQIEKISNILGFSTGLSAGAQITVTGYPGKGSAGDNTGKEHYTCSGNVLDFNTQYFKYDADTTGGQSGSPVYNSKNYIVGVHHGGSSSQGGNYAARVKGELYTTMNAIRTGTYTPSTQYKGKSQQLI